MKLIYCDTLQENIEFQSNRHTSLSITSLSDELCSCVSIYLNILSICETIKQLLLTSTLFKDDTIFLQIDSFEGNWPHDFQNQYLGTKLN